MRGAHAVLAAVLVLAMTTNVVFAQTTVTYSSKLTAANVIPKANGGTTYPPLTLCTTYTTTAACVWSTQPTTLSAPASDTVAFWTSAFSQAGSRTCTQSTDARCTSAALAAVFGSFHQIKAAWCNDNWLVVITNLMPFQPSTGTTPNLADTANPPGGTSADGSACVTRTWWGANRGYAFKLTPTPLSTSLPSNNLAYFTSTSTQIVSSVYSTSYGLPVDGSVGMTVWGQDIFPVFNNRGTYTPEQCEVDSCNQHVGQGGGSPHLHGDPFGTYCGYSAANYSSLAAHPPLIGFGNDGYWIYGRHLSTSAPGYSTALDLCGGHIHSTADATTTGISVYHYHMAVIDTVTDTGGSTDATKTVGTSYQLQTTGVFQCYKGDLTQDNAFSTTATTRTATQNFCKGSTNYYVASVPTGLSLSTLGAGTQSTTATTTSPPPPASTTASSPPPPPPPPSPSPPPGTVASSPPPPATVTATAQSYTFQVSGSTTKADYTTANCATSGSTCAKLVAAIASAAGVSTSAVSVVATARRRSLLSATVVATVTFPSATAASAFSTTATASINTAVVAAGISGVSGVSASSAAAVAGAGAAVLAAVALLAAF